MTDPKMWPTPAVNDMGENKTPEQWDAWTAAMKDRHGNGNGHGPSLSIEAQRPTPSSTCSAATEDSPSPSRLLWPTATVTSGAQTAENPTPGQTGGTTLEGAVRQYSAPSASRRSSPMPVPCSPIGSLACPTSDPFSQSPEIAYFAAQITERLRLLQRASRASRSPMPGSAKGRATSDTSGPSLPTPFATLEARSLSLRTCRDFSLCRQEDAYAAGIIDGEGWIGISRFNRNALPTFQPGVEVTMTEKALAVIQWLQSEYGGNVYKKPDPQRPENAPCYRWSIVGEPAAIFLQKISPALLLKVEQAELIQKLLRIMGPMPTSRRRTWTREMSGRAQELYEEMKRLNRRGPTQEMMWTTGQHQLDGSLETFSGTFPRSGMLASGKLYPLPTLERPIDGSGSGSSVLTNWPTSRAEDGESAGRRVSRGVADTLTAKVREESWLTPRANEPEDDPGFVERNGDRGAHCSGSLGQQVKKESTRLTPSASEDAAGTTNGKMQEMLSHQVRRIFEAGPPPTASGRPDPVKRSTGGSQAGSWATPSASEGTGAGAGPNLRSQVAWGTHTAASSVRSEEFIRDTITPAEFANKAGGKLNPEWVSCLMGLPMGWVALPYKFKNPKKAR